MKKPHVLEISGAKVVLYPMKEVESVMVSVRFHAGSWYEEKEWGAHHLLEHVMLDGSTKFNDEETIEIYKEEHGLSTNGATGRDILEFYVYSPKTQYNAGLDLLFDSVFHPLLRKEDIEKNKTIIAQEYRDKWSNPNVRYGKAINNNLYGVSHPYTRDGMGEMDFVQKLTEVDLKKIHEKFCVPENAVIVVAGNFTVQEMKNVLTTHLSTARHGAGHEYSVTEGTLSLPYLFWSEDVSKVTVDVIWSTNVITENSSLYDRLSVNIGRYILGGSSRSRLSRELRMKRGWVYHAFASKGHFPTSSFLVASTSTDTSKAKDVRDILISEVERFVSAGVTDTEFERARNFLNMQLMMSYDSVQSIASKLMNDLFFEDTIYMPDNLIEITNSITKEDVIRLFTSFTKETPVIGVMAKEDPQIAL